MSRYGVSTVSACPWLSGKTSKPRAEKNSKKSTEVRICYPLFLECSKIVDDPFWRNILARASTGKLPPRFSYDGSHTLNYRHRNHIKALHIPASIHEAASCIIAFLREHGNLSSDADQANVRRLELEEYHNELEKELKWSSLRKRMRNVYLGHFINDLKEKYKLKPTEEDALRSLLKRAITLKLITNDHIIFEERRIKEIVCLLFDTTKKTFFLDETQIKRPEVTPFIPRQEEGEGKQDKSRVVFLANWAKTVADMQAKREKGQRGLVLRFTQKEENKTSSRSEDTTAEPSSLVSEDGERL